MVPVAGVARLRAERWRGKTVHHQSVIVIPVAVPEAAVGRSAIPRLPSTAATRSTRFICHWQRSYRSPFDPLLINTQNKTTTLR